MRDLLKDGQAASSGPIYQLDYIIAQREREPKRHTGFNLIDPLTGMDKRNRRGRRLRERGESASDKGRRERQI